MIKRIGTMLKLAALLAMVASLSACDVYTTGPYYYGPHYCRYHRCGGPHWRQRRRAWRRWHRHHPGPYYR